MRKLEDVLADQRARKTPRNEPEQRAAMHMAEDALSGLKHVSARTVLLDIITTHRGLSPVDLEILSNEIGRLAHERARHG